MGSPLTSGRPPVYPSASRLVDLAELSRLRARPTTSHIKSKQMLNKSSPQGGKDNEEKENRIVEGEQLYDIVTILHCPDYALAGFIHAGVPQEHSLLAARNSRLSLPEGVFSCYWSHRGLARKRVKN